MATSTAALAGPAATLLPAEAFVVRESPAAPVGHEAFLPGPDALAAEPLAGVLSTAPATMDALPRLSGPVIGGRDARLFPGIELELLSDGDRLVPLQRGRLVRETRAGLVPSYWRVIPQFGRVWREPGDGGWSRAALPLILVNDTENHAHQGVATFLYRDGAVSALRFQFAQQTAPYLLKQHFMLWGGTSASFVAGRRDGHAAELAAARRELADRLPARPWSELLRQFPPGTLDGFGGPLYPKWQVINALVYRGTLYYQESATPLGPYPYPLEMRFGVRSVMKSVAAPLALLRLAEVYGPYVLDLRIGAYVPGLDPKFARVRFIDAANMATGFGGMGSFKTHPNNPYDGYLDGDYDAWYTAESLAEKISQINRNLKPYPWEPGTVMRYRDQDYFLLGVALDEFLKSVRGPDADLWDMLATEVLRPIGIHQAPAVRTREPGGRDGVVWANAGYYPTLDDLAKIALLVQRRGAHAGQQLLHRGLTADLLAARRAIVPDGDASRDTASAAAGGRHEQLYLMGWRFLRHLSPRTRTIHYLPSMHGSGENRVVLYPNGAIYLQMAKAAELPPGEKAMGDDAAASSRLIDRLPR
jgi:hypothetical protein